jgi:hypothetical protein
MMENNNYIWDVQLSKNGYDKYIINVFASSKKTAVQQGKAKAAEMGFDYIETFIDFHKKDKWEVQA